MPSAGDPPGWMPDPDRSGGLRWWNGLDWSDARRAVDDSARQVQAQVQQAAASSTVNARNVAKTITSRQTYPAFQEVRRTAVARATGGGNGLAIGAVVLGVVSLILGFTGILPIVAVLVSLGALARSRRLSREGATGTGLVPSLIGLVLSVISVLTWAPVVVAIVQAFVEAFTADG